jgi:excisionase family DNA binding protein
MKENYPLVIVSPDDLQRLITDGLQDALSTKNADESFAQKKDLLNRKEATELLSISYPTLKRYVKEGLIPFYKIRGRVYFKHSELMNSLEKNKIINEQK